MVEVGKMNTLAVSRMSDFGLLLDGGDLGEIPLPKRESKGIGKADEKLEVFVYLDSEDRLVATTRRPKAQVGEFALLRCTDAAAVGAFLDWGLPKDLFVPFREQRIKMRKGSSYLVYIYFDKASGRIVASSKLDKFLNESRRFFKVGEEVELMAWQQSDLGWKFIIEGKRWGMVFKNEIFQSLERGQKLKGFIKNVRPDGRIDLTLQKPGYEKVTDLTETILNHLRRNNGFMPITNESEPERINALFGVSKKTYKKAIGALYKKRLIEFTDKGTKLTE